jgi:hypothetical protein
MAEDTAWSNLIEVYSGMKEGMEEMDLSILLGTLRALNNSNVSLNVRKDALKAMNSAWNFLRNANVAIPKDLQTAHDELYMFVEMAEHS